MIVQLLTKHSSDIALYCENNTPVILLQNGVYAAVKLLEDFPLLTIYALHNDWLASGLAENPLVNLISAQQWVELCAVHHPVITFQATN